LSGSIVVFFVDMFLEVFLFLCLLFSLFYWHCTKQFGFFKIRGIPFAEPSFPFGSSNAKQALMGKVAFIDIDKLLVESDQFKNEKVMGYFFMGQPNFLINDEELAKKIMIADFDHFTDLRNFAYKGHSKENKLFNSMFPNMKGEDWKKGRRIFNPAFTGSKLKTMIPHLARVGAQMSKYVNENCGQEFEARDFFSKFTMDGLASAGFGIDIDSFKDPDSNFRKMALTLIQAPGYGTPWDIPRFIFTAVAPKLAKLFQVPLMDVKSTMFFANIIEQTIKRRKESKERRGDLVDISLDMLEGEYAKKLTDEEKELYLVGNLLVLFIAGFDTTSISMCQVIQQLMFNQNIQDKVFEEIEEVFGEETEDITWEKVQSCVYLDNVISESLRFMNLIPMTERLCTKDYKIPDTDITIPKGRTVKIYFHDMMKNEKNFKNVGEFDPDNFLPENKHNKFAFQAFGQGPRGCIGSRFAMMNMKMSLLCVLRSHRIVPCSRSKEGPPEMDPNQIFAIKGGTWFKTEERS